MGDGMHSPLGASSAKRWMACPSSATLIRQQKIIGKDSEWAMEGTVAHEVAAMCLEGDQDAWEIVGQRIKDHDVTCEMAEAVQVYLDYCRSIMADKGVKVFIEYGVKLERLHESLWGTADFVAISRDVLYIADYKHGAGVKVETAENEQMMYYAYAVLMSLPEGDRPETVSMAIVQPRYFGFNGVEDYCISSAELEVWGSEVLLPAMEVASADNPESFCPGSHCQFCPAKLQCPALTGMFRAALASQLDGVPKMTDAQLGLEWAQIEAVKFYITAVQREVEARLLKGKPVPGLKLVAKRADRVWKDGAASQLRAVLGDAAFNEPKLKSPSEVSKISKGARGFVAEWAFTPQTGYTVAPLSDNREGVTPPSGQDIFGSIVSGLEA